MVNLCAIDINHDFMESFHETPLYHTFVTENVQNIVFQMPTSMMGIVCR